MSHYSEMNFLFDSKTNQNSITQQVDITGYDSQVNVLRGQPKFVVYKGENTAGTNEIKKYYSQEIYKNPSVNPYVNLIKEFSDKPGLKISASDLAYLRDLGVYPINRMAILRRFPEGCFVYENLEEMTIEPISVIVGWIKPDQNFGSIGFNETWTVTDKRFDQLLVEIIGNQFGLKLPIMPIPDWAQGMLFELYKRADLTTTSVLNEGVDEDYETFASGIKKSGIETGDSWGLKNIPVGDPNVLKEGPFRDPEHQNISSSFSFELVTTYEQKLIGDVDPGSAMLDILDNMYAMGTSNMAFYWGDAAPSIVAARKASEKKGNEIENWWKFVTVIMSGFTSAIIELFNDTRNKFNEIIQYLKTPKANPTNPNNIMQEGLDFLNSILTSTIAIYRFKLRGSIELMVGGKISATPWYLTIGNPHSPWLATNHIIIKSAKVETSNELGFNDLPQWLTATFSCEFSRSLGKQELMRMFNNSYRRTYSNPKGSPENPVTLKEAVAYGKMPVKKSSDEGPTIDVNTNSGGPSNSPLRPNSGSKNATVWSSELSGWINKNIPSNGG